MIARLPGTPDELFAVVQGLLVHEAAREHLYGPLPPHGRDAPRATLAVAERLDDVLRLSPDPLDRPRPPALRSVGTCRDFALLLCALLRAHGFAARVRCGFADYLRPGPWEDHWICEYADPASDRWRLADAQLDAAHRANLGIAFDPRDLPRLRFLNAPQAWRAARRSGTADAFGHGTARGLWFLRVNLERDRLARAGRETSRWDRWRDIPDAERRLGRLDTARCDALERDRPRWIHLGRESRSILLKAEQNSRDR